MSSQAFDLPVPARGENPDGYSTTTLLLEGDLLLTSWVDGIAAVRVGVLHLADGSWRILKGVRGMLRDALALPGDRALLLTDYGLFEIDLALLTVTRKLTAKIGRHNTSMQRVSDDVVAVGNDAKATDILVSLAAWEPVGRRRRVSASARLVDAASARAGIIRVLDERDGLVVGATSPHPGEHGQRMLVLDTAGSVACDEVMPWGVASVVFWGGGIIASPLRLAEHVPLRAIASVPGCRVGGAHDLAALQQHAIAPTPAS